MLELNRAKFSANGNSGYILKPKYMRKGKHASVPCAWELQISKVLGMFLDLFRCL